MPTALVRRYDTEMYAPLALDFYEGSGFCNYGYWIPETNGAKQASENLVDRLLAGVANDGLILDVACGTGATTRHLLKSRVPAQVVAVNISEKQLQTAREAAPGCTFLAMDAAALGFKDSLFDSVICVEAAFHFRTREAFVREAHRVLKPAGSLVLSDIIMRQPPVTLNRGRWIRENAVASLDEYRQLFVRAGYENVTIIDTTEQSWKSFRRHMLQWGRRRVVAGQMSVLRFVAGFVVWTLVGALTKNYVLVSATKPGPHT